MAIRAGGNTQKFTLFQPKETKTDKNRILQWALFTFCPPVRLALASRYAATLRKKTETARPVSRQSVLFAHLRLLDIRYYKQFSKIQYLMLEFF